MQETVGHAPISEEMERSEFESVLESLAGSPRLASLLRYMGDNYFAGKSEQLNEYNIATEVLGRSKTVFDSGNDAIVRVEAHRLRKKLKDFYDSTGKNHPIRLSVPNGTYVPVFEGQTTGDFPSVAARESAIPASRAAASPVSSAAPAQNVPPGQLPPAASPSYRPFILRAGLLAAALACAAAAVFYAVSHFHRAGSAGAAGRQPAMAGSGLPAGVVPANVPLRILAGYNGRPQMDSAGAIWQADRYGVGGGSWHSSGTALARTSDQLLFQQWRTGDFSYNIPLRPGIYELHLYFVTPEPSNEDLSTFGIMINGKSVLAGFDVNSDAMGANIADERVFRDISPASDGFLHIQFTSERGSPRLNAIEILQGIPHATLPIRIITQRTPFTDRSGQFWHPDNYFMNGRMSEQPKPITGASDPNLFSTERYGHFSYALPVDPRDRYTLVLHFVEFYFGPDAQGRGGAGSRVFRVLCNGETLLDNFDIYKEAGSLHVLTKTFYHIKPSAQGKLNVTFEPITNNATVSGIEVLDEAQ